MIYKPRTAREWAVVIGCYSFAIGAAVILLLAAP